MSLALEDGELKTATHTCPACGQEIYAEQDHDFMDQCFGCRRTVTLQYTPGLQKQVMVFD